MRPCLEDEVTAVTGGASGCNKSQPDTTPEDRSRESVGYRAKVPTYSALDTMCPLMARSRSFLLAPGFKFSVVSRA